MFGSSGLAQAEHPLRQGNTSRCVDQWFIGHCGGRYTAFPQPVSVSMPISETHHPEYLLDRLPRRALARQLQSPSWIIRHVALCRVAMSGDLRPPEVRRQELAAALTELKSRPCRECITTLLSCELRLVEMRLAEPAGRRKKSSYCSTVELEFQAAQLRSTSAACLREHAR